MPGLIWSGKAASAMTIQLRWPRAGRSSNRMSRQSGSAIASSAGTARPLAFGRGLFRRPAGAPG